MDLKMDNGELPDDAQEKKRRAQLVADREREKREQSRADFRARLLTELRRLFSYLVAIALVVFVCLHWTQIRSFVSHYVGPLQPHIVPTHIYATNYEQQVNEAGAVK